MIAFIAKKFSLTSNAGISITMMGPAVDGYPCRSHLPSGSAIRMITHGALGLLSGGRARQHADELFAQRYTTATSLPPMLRPVLDGLLALNIDMAMDAVAIRLGTWQWGMLFVGALMTLIVLALHRTVGRFKVGPKMIKGYSDSRSATRQSLDPPVEGAARALARSWTLVSQDVRFADTAAPLNGLEVS